MFVVEKIEDKKIAFETNSGIIMVLTSLQYAVAQNITFPMSQVCPTSIRYELAKYEVASVKKAYNDLFAVFGEIKNDCFDTINEKNLSFLSESEKNKLIETVKSKIK